MVQENEIVMLLLGLGVLIFMLGNRQRIKSIPASNILTACFYTLVTGWVFTVIEGFIWPGFFNLLEHLCYAGSSVLMAVWCWKIFGRREKTSWWTSSSPLTSFLLWHWSLPVGPFGMGGKMLYPEKSKCHSPRSLRWPYYIISAMFLNGEE